MSSALLQRVLKPSYRKKIMKPEEAIKFIKNGMSLGWSGFTPAGYPKVIPIALADHVQKTGEKMQFDLFCGASMGAESENRWAELNMIKRRWPYQTGKAIAKGINTGKIAFGDTHLSMFGQNLEYGFYTTRNKTNTGKLDCAIIECTKINEDGGLVLGTGVGATPEMCKTAEKIIIEVNTKLPVLEGMHDVECTVRPPHRKPFLISRVDDRIGSAYQYIESDKIVAIVESNLPDNGRGFSAVDNDSKTIAGHIIDFFNTEVKAGRLPKNLLPLQSGVGNIANAVTAGLASSPFEHLTVWTEVLQDTMLDLFDCGKLDAASAVSLSLSPKGFERFYSNLDKYKNKVILRPQAIANHCECVRRLGVIAMNTPLEVDIYAHANSSLIGGTRMVNGLGGSGDFLRNAYLSIMHTPSVRKSKNDPHGISCIVPMCSHIDHTEHDLDVIVTEQGVADCRGLAPRQRAKEIITHCAHPEYKEQLLEYYNMAEKDCVSKGIGHEPVLFDLVHKMHLNLTKNGTMKLKSWNDQI